MREPPQEDQQFRDAEVAERALPGPHVGGVEELVERRVGQRGAVRRSQVGQAAGRGAGQRADQALGRISSGGDAAGSPVPGNGAGPRSPGPGRGGCGRGGGRTRRRGASQPVMSAASSSRTPACPCGGGSRSSWRRPAAGPRRRGRRPGSCQQVADVGDDPVVAGLDRLVVPQPVDAAAHDGRLGADPVDQLLQRPGRARRRRCRRCGRRAGSSCPQPLGVVGVVAVVDVSHWRHLR